MKEERELYRVREGKWIAGVCTGMAQYMGLTPTIVRLIFVAMVPLAFGAGILLYIASIFMIHWEPETPAEEADETEEVEETEETAEADEKEETEETEE